VRTKCFAAAYALVFSSAPDAIAGLEPTSRNAVLFVESAQEGHEWEAYRLAEDRRPVVLRVDGPGRVLLSLRTFAREGAEPAVAVVLLDDRIVLTSRVDPKVDESAKFPDQQEAPSKVRFYLVRVPSGSHEVTIRYSGGAPTLAAARFSENADTWEERGEGEPTLLMPNARDRDDVPSIGKLHATEGLEAEPKVEKKQKSWKPARRPERAVIEEPHVGPHFSRENRMSTRGSGTALRELTVEAPWLMIEIHGGAQIDHLGLSVAPRVGADGRIPIPGLDARSFSAGLSASVAHTQGESELQSSNGAAIGVARVRHTAFALSADVRWVLLHGWWLDPYVAIGGGGIFGSMSSSVEDSRISAATRGVYGLGVAGAAWGGSGDRPYLEARVQAGLLSSELIRSNRGPYLAGSLMIGWRFEFLTPVAAYADAP
jgi:hypothetical protein